mgnify:CR=1 FL=1
MAAHLSHKIRWDFLADYLTPYSDVGITLPVGECGQIHASKKKHKIQVEMRKYISDNMICSAEDCETTGEKWFCKSNKKGRPFARGKRNDKKLKMFTENFCNVINEFASAELKSPFKTVEYVAAENLSLSNCSHCDEFITYLEFGDKRKLFEYSDTNLKGILQCLHGGQAVGNNIRFLLWYVVKFYLYSNIIVYLDLRTEEQWPSFMKPDSWFRKTLLSACDGQTFLPHSRKYLPRAMIDLDETRLLSKNLFRFVYFYVMMRMRLDSSYSVHDEFGTLLCTVRIMEE